VVTTDLRSSGAGMRRLDVEAALGDVTRRLTGRFSPQLPESVVAATVRDCAAHWREARVTDFVPLLVERRSVERLRELLAEHTASHDGTGTPGPGGYSQVA
jgi:hypothetical protein